MTSKIIHLMLSPLFLALCVAAVVMGRDSRDGARRLAYQLGCLGLVLFGVGVVALFFGLTQLLVVFVPKAFAVVYWAAWAGFYFASFACVWVILSIRKQERRA